MKQVEVVGTVQDVANVIQELFQHMEILVVGESSDEIGPYVTNILKDFKVTFTEEVTSEGHSIKIYD
ncbi:hypothetical protein [Pseudoneobacillus sp. C159]